MNPLARLSPNARRYVMFGVGGVVVLLALLSRRSSGPALPAGDPTITTTAAKPGPSLGGGTPGDFSTDNTGFLGQLSGDVTAGLGQVSLGLQGVQDSNAYVTAGLGDVNAGILALSRQFAQTPAPGSGGPSVGQPAAIDPGAGGSAAPAAAAVAVKAQPVVISSRPQPRTPSQSPAAAGPKKGFLFVQDSGPRSGLSYNVVKTAKGGVRVYENGDRIGR